MAGNSNAALFVLRALIEQLVDNGTFSKDQVAQIMERAKAMSNSEYPTRSSRRGEEDILDDLKKKLER
jgi:hypothetical protein